MITEHLYFISVIPQQPVKNKIQQIKKEFSDTFHVFHALKSPPHITLIPPFKIHHSEVPRLSEYLSKFAQEFAPFKVNIENYDSFKPRVIFLKPILTKELLELYNSLNTRFYDSFPVGEPSKRPFHPHITIAFRDLKPNIFHKAWKEFKTKSFQASIIVDRIFLLQHNGKRWEELKNYPFNIK